MKYRYTAEEDAFIVDSYEAGLSYTQIAAESRRRFNRKRTSDSVRSRALKLGMAPRTYIPATREFVPHMCPVGRDMDPATYNYAKADRKFQERWARVYGWRNFEDVHAPAA